MKAMKVASAVLVALGISLSPVQPIASAQGQPTTPRIVFLLGRDLTVDYGNVAVMNLDGSDLQVLTVRHLLREDPTWSPDGKRIAWVVVPSELGSSIHVMNADGTGMIALTGEAYSNINPNWSPDGRLIAFASDRAGNPNYEIYTMHPDGTRVKRITRMNGADYQPDWSPDGNLIAFQHNSSLYVMNADGTGIRKLTGCGGTCLSKELPDWSPDASKIVFMWNKDPHYELRTINADGTGEKVLLDCKSPCLAVQDPAWSPDGTLIAFTYVDFDVGRHAYIMNADGTNLRRLPSRGMDTCCVRWQPAVSRWPIDGM